MRKVGDILWTIGSYGLALLGGTLPRRWWPRMDESIPVSRCSLWSGIVMAVFSASIGIPGFLAHLQGNTSRGAEMVMRAGRWIPSAGPIPTDEQANAVFMVSYLSPLTFLFTPLGIASIYLGVTGYLRAVSAYVDDPRGDPILTWVDSMAWKRRQKMAARQATRSREELEGPEVPDRLVSGQSGGFPDADFVVVASRRKPGWERGVFVITPELWYRLGTPVERHLPAGLRTFYPLTEIRDLEVVRKSVEYVLPPLSGSLPPPSERTDA